MSKSNEFKKAALIKAVALMSFASAVSAGGGNPSVSLVQTVGTDLGPGACAVDQVLSVAPGTQVNFCYTITNDGDESLSVHDLDTSVYGSLLSGFSSNLNMGESLSFNDIRAVSSNVINEAEWSSGTPFVYNVNLLSGGDFVYNDISGSGTPLNVGDEDEANITIPFSFNYFGTISTDLRVGSNGGALFGVTTGEVDFNPLALPTADLPIMAPFWMDLDDSIPNGQVYWEAQGVSPNQTLTVQWHERKQWNGIDAENVTFQMVLFETTNEIQFVYPDVIFGGSAVGNDGGAAASIGIDSGDGTNAIQYSLNGSTLIADMTSISFVPDLASFFEASDTSLAAVSVLIPDVAVTPGLIDTQVDSLGTGSELLIISNEGQGNLNWTVDETDAFAPTPKPESLYVPISTSGGSPGADKSPQSQSAITHIPLGVTSTAIAYDVRNGFFGGIDHTAPGDFNSVVASARPMFAGDFVNSDFNTLYAIDNDDRSLYMVDVATGVETLVALTTPDTTGETFSGLTQGFGAPTVYVSTTDGVNSFLYTIDLVTGVLTPVGEVTNSALLIDIAMNTSGELFGLDIGIDSLISIDPLTGAGTVIGALGVDVSFAQGMDFDDATNTLYMTGYIGGGVNEVRTINTSTGASTLVGSVNELTGGAELDAFGIATLGDNCYSPVDITWMSLSHGSGIVGAGDTDEVTVNFDASGLADGIYESNVCVFSDDPDELLTKIPVTLQVGPDDLIFADGFEAPIPPPPFQ